MRKLYKRKFSKDAKSRKAFTLAELIFEIVVLTFLIVPAVLLLGQLTMNVVEAESNSIGSLLGINKTEEVLDYYENNGFDYDFTSLSDAVTDATGVYTRQVAFQCLAADLVTPAVCSTADYKKITITVSHGSIPDIVIDLLLADL